MILRDPVSSASHLAVALLATFALLWMLRRSHAGPAHLTATAIFGGSMVLLYLASGVFHGLPLSLEFREDEFRLFQNLDQSAIFALIAGTNTPIMAAFLRGRFRAFCLAAMWTLAASAIAAIWLLPKAQHWLIVAACLAMGWLGMLPMRTYYRAVGWRAMNLVWLGCLLYSAGALCELAEWPVLSESPIRFGPHEAFHLFDAAASLAFFVFIIEYAIPLGLPSPTPNAPTSHSMPSFIEPRSER